jgi:hypothetical protein
MGLHAAKANGQQYGFRKSTLWAGMKHRPKYNTYFVYNTTKDSHTT